MLSVGYVVLVLIVYVLALARLVRLVNADTILDRPRLALAGRAKQARLTADEAAAHGQTERAAIYHRTMTRWNVALYFVQCPWCVGMWLAFATAWVPLYFTTNPVAVYVATALAASHLIGLFARFADTEEIQIEDDDDQ